MKRELTPKQEKFCHKYIELGNASEAYRQSYNAENMKPESVNRMAKDLLDNLKISSRLAELQQEHQQRHNVTVDSLTAELEQARMMAIAEALPSAMVSASLGKAKIHGLDKTIIEGNIPLVIKKDHKGNPDRK